MAFTKLNRIDDAVQEISKLLNLDLPKYPNSERLFKNTINVLMNESKQLLDHLYMSKLQQEHPLFYHNLRVTFLTNMFQLGGLTMLKV